MTEPAVLARSARYPHAFDSTDPRSILEAHPHPWGIFPYGDGWYAQAWRNLIGEFPEARRRWFSVIPPGDPQAADLFDSEAGCLTAQEAAAAARERKRLFPADTPGIYCNRAEPGYDVAAVAAACRDAGLTEWDLFLATLDGSIPTEIEGIRPKAVQAWGGPHARFDEWVILDPACMREPPR